MELEQADMELGTFFVFAPPVSTVLRKMAAILLKQYLLYIKDLEILCVELSPFY